VTPDEQDSTVHPSTELGGDEDLKSMQKGLKDPKKKGRVPRARSKAYLTQSRERILGGGGKQCC